MANDISSQLQLDASRLQSEIHKRGYSTVQDFADAVGVHRNTVGNYLAGKTALPAALTKILLALDLAPADVLSLPFRRRQVPGLMISDLTESLRAAAPQAVFVLFGSRARGRAKRHSDYDVGVFCCEGLEFALFSRLLDQVGVWNQDSLATAQLVDLTRADGALLQGLSEGVEFLAGSHAAWCELLCKAGIQLYE